MEGFPVVSIGYLLRAIRFLRLRTTSIKCINSLYSHQFSFQLQWKLLSKYRKCTPRRQFESLANCSVRFRDETQRYTDTWWPQRGLSPRCICSTLLEIVNVAAVSTAKRSSRKYRRNSSDYGSKVFIFNICNVKSIIQIAYLAVCVHMLELSTSNL